MPESEQLFLWAGWNIIAPGYIPPFLPFHTHIGWSMNSAGISYVGYFEVITSSYCIPDNASRNR